MADGTRVANDSFDLIFNHVKYHQISMKTFSTSSDPVIVESHFQQLFMASIFLGGYNRGPSRA